MSQSNENSLINVGMKTLNDKNWDGTERRAGYRANAARKFQEVRLPAFETNDQKLNMSGVYPANS